MLPGLELMYCPNMAVSMDVMKHVVRVESSRNPYAIGVVGGHLVRQPKNLAEALATVRMLEIKGFNFSLGLAQVNRYNLDKYGLDSYEKAFQECPNLQAGSQILADCYKRLGGDWGKSFSCYYSGNSVTGYQHGYVQKVFASMRHSEVAATNVSPALAIEVVGKPSRRVVGISRHPVYAASAQPRLQQRVEGASALLQTMPALAAASTAQLQNRTTNQFPQQATVVALTQQPESSAAHLKPMETTEVEATAIVDRAFVF